MSTAKSIICFFFEHNLPKPMRFSLPLEVGRSTSKAREVRQVCQVRLNRVRISVPNESGRSGERFGGEGNSKMEQRGPSSRPYRLRFSCTSTLAINFAYSFEQLFKGDCKPEYLRPSRTLERV